jgi:hypothetical protein
LPEIDLKKMNDKQWRIKMHSYRFLMLVFWMFVMPVAAYAVDLPSPPPEPEVKPMTSSDYELDTDDNRIDDELDSQLSNATLEELLLPVEVELVFNKQITREQIEAFANLGGEFKYIFRAVSYGWIGVLPLGQVGKLIQVMGDSLVLIGQPKEAQLTDGGGYDAVEEEVIKVSPNQ